MAKIGLISCVSKKLDHAAPASDFYTSALFKKSRHYALERLDGYYILSAKYGLLRPEEKIDSYDETLNSMSRKQKQEWAGRIFQRLIREITVEDQIVFLAGVNYREFLEQELRANGFRTATPLSGLGIGEQLGRYTTFAEIHDYVSDLDRFYASLRSLRDRLGGVPSLKDIGRQDLPNRGVYFFFEPAEFRKTAPFERRVVRVGTHSVSKGSRATLWSRLKTHRGNRMLAGNHRSSIFRLHTGKSLINQLGIESETWGQGKRLPKEGREQERIIEIQVSNLLREMGVLWLSIGDEAGPRSDRTSRSEIFRRPNSNGGFRQKTLF